MRKTETFTTHTKQFCLPRIELLEERRVLSTSMLSPVGHLVPSVIQTATAAPGGLLSVIDGQLPTLSLALDISPIAQIRLTLGSEELLANGIQLNARLSVGGPEGHGLNLSANLLAGNGNILNTDVEAYGGEGLDLWIDTQAGDDTSLITLGGDVNITTQPGSELPPNPIDGGGGSVPTSGPGVVGGGPTTELGLVADDSAALANGATVLLTAFGDAGGTVDRIDSAQGGEVEPASRLDLNAGVPDSSSATEPSLPNPSGLLTEASPFSLATMENALQSFLDQLAEVSENLESALDKLGVMPWLLMGLTMTALVSECVKRRAERQKRHAHVVGDGSIDASNWFPGQ